jgi:hypothetical protein
MTVSGPPKRETVEIGMGKQSDHEKPSRSGKVGESIEDKQQTY